MHWIGICENDCSTTICTMPPCDFSQYAASVFQSQGKEQKQAAAVLAAANAWRRSSAAKGTGYLTVRAPNGDSLLTHTALTDGGGMEDLSKDGSLAHVLPDSDEWEELLVEVRARGTAWTDPTFPPSAKSLFRKGSEGPSWADEVHGWARVGDVFHQSHTLRLTFSEEDGAPGCYGYSSRADPAPDATAQVPAAYRAAADAAVRAACRLAAAGFAAVAGGASAVAELVALGGDMGANLRDKNVFGKIDREHRPLVFAGLDEANTFVVERVAEKGYVPMLTVQVTALFAPVGGLHLFEDGADAGDVKQGALGDCYFLGALSVVGCNQKQLMNIFPSVGASDAPQDYNEEGVYAVRLWRGGAWRIVVVDDWIPVGASGQPVFAQLPSGSCEFWPLIAEKAYAKLNGSYEAIEGGHENIALQDLTGGVAFTVDLGAKLDVDKWRAVGSGDADGLVDYVRARLAEGSHIGVSKSNAGGGRSDQIMGGHAYGILHVDAYQGTTLVQVMARALRHGASPAHLSFALLSEAGTPKPSLCGVYLARSGTLGARAKSGTARSATATRAGFACLQPTKSASGTRTTQTARGGCRSRPWCPSSTPCRSAA